MNPEGWVKLWRRIELSDIWELSPLAKVVFIWILLHASHEAHTWNGMHFKAGELLTSYAAIAKGVAWKENRRVIEPSTKTVRWILTTLAARQVLRHEPRQGGTWITVLHWEDYQGDTATTRAGTKAGARAGQGQDKGSIQEGKKVEKKDKHMSEFDTFWTLYPRKQSKGKAREYWARALKKTTAEEIIAALKQQQPYLLRKYKEDSQWVKLPGSWLNGECWLDEIPAEGGATTHKFTPEEERQIGAAIALMQSGRFEDAQFSVDEELYTEVRRRYRGTNE